MVTAWSDMVGDAARRGFGATRVVGEPTWALEPEQSVDDL
jgi:hypothetical protein